MELDKKSNPQYRNLQKTSNPQVKTQIHKKQAQIRGKTARLVALLARIGAFRIDS